MRMKPSPSNHWVASALAVMLCSCPRVREEPVRVPEDPPATLELFGASLDDDEELPPATEPLRRDACGVPLALSSAGLMGPEGIGRVQSRLVEEGILAAGDYQEGSLDATTIAAIVELQGREDLPQVGLPTYSTVRALGIDLDEAFHTGDESCEGAR